MKAKLPTTANTDQEGEVDLLEQIDEQVDEQSDELEVDDSIIAQINAIGDALPALEEEESLHKEIDAIAVPEPPSAKKSSHMLPQELINKPLTVDDLVDEGSI